MGQRQDLSDGEQFDLIVVGGGVGGCILAARIAQLGVNPENGEKPKIALFEWGPYHKGEPRRGYGIPSRRGAFDGMPYELARYYTLPWGSLGMVGGATQWAGMISHLPEPLDFGHWRAETGVDWTWEKFNLPLTEVREMWHPYPEAEEVRAPGQQRFREVALRLGYEVHEVAQAKLNCPRCGDCNGRICRYDAKSTPLVTYVPIAERYGVRILGQTPVEKVVIEKKGARPIATGVVYRSNGVLRQAKAGKILVSCGYNGTPRLLYRSGYGPRQKVQGELLAENRNVGTNLCASLKGGRIDVLFDEPIKHPDIGVHGVYYVARNLDPRGYNRLIVFESLGAREGSRHFPDQLALSPLAPDFGREHKRYMRTCTTHVGGVTVELTKNVLRGEINPDGRVVVPGNELGSETEGGVDRHFLERNHPEIIEALLEGQQIALKILREMSPREIVGGEGLEERLIFNLSSSTCRAGASREHSVVNSDFESHDVDNLFICDSSVLPTQATGNVSMPTATVCSYAWRRIVARHFSREPLAAR